MVIQKDYIATVDLPTLKKVLSCAIQYTVCILTSVAYGKIARDVSHKYILLIWAHQTTFAVQKVQLLYCFLKHQQLGDYMIYVLRFLFRR